MQTCDQCRHTGRLPRSSDRRSPCALVFDRLVVLQEKKENPKYCVKDFIVELNDARIIGDFSRNIFNLFEKMLKRFPVCSLSLKEYISFCWDNVSDETVRPRLRIILYYNLVRPVVVIILETPQKKSLGIPCCYWV